MSNNDCISNYCVDGEIPALPEGFEVPVIPDNRRPQNLDYLALYRINHAPIEGEFGPVSRTRFQKLNDP